MHMYICLNMHTDAHPPTCAHTRTHIFKILDALLVLLFTFTLLFIQVFWSPLQTLSNNLTTWGR